MLLKRSFTLIEISIVLIVMSFLTILVLSGKYLMGISHANNVIQTINTYRQAITNFYTSSLYSGHLPGDYFYARSTFSPNDYTLDNISSAVLVSALQNGKQKDIALDGNADGEVSAKIVSFNNENSLYYSEVFGVWAHLGHAHMIDKLYSNVCNNIATNNIADCVLPGLNLPVIVGGINGSAYLFYKPKSNNEFDNGLFGVLEGEYNYSSHILLLADMTNHRILGMNKNIEKYIVGGGGGISAEIMRKIDIKTDDGHPLTGSVFGLNGSEQNNKCSNYDGTTTSSYDATISKEKIIYNDDVNQNCIGVITFNEFQ